jgi:hypothetical protein
MDRTDPIHEGLLSQAFAELPSLDVAKNKRYKILGENEIVVFQIWANHWPVAHFEAKADRRFNSGNIWEASAFASLYLLPISL